MSAEALPAGAVPGWLSRLHAGLADRSAAGDVVRQRPGRGGRPAAVLVLVSGTEVADASVLFVERAHTMRNHPGQLAFPGGGIDEADAGVADAALREAEEETGLDRDDVAVLGVVPAAHVAVSGYDVSAVVGWWHTPGPVGVNDPAEVAQVVVEPLSELINSDNRVTVRLRAGYRGPGFWITDDTGERLLVWGLTAHLLDGVLDLAGWTRPWDRSREIEVPQRFLRDVRRVAGTNPHDQH
ncbi:NUDIX hydrolase [Propionibacteriaceae bacterium Y2011]